MKTKMAYAAGFGLLVLLVLGLRFGYYEPLDRSVSGHDTERYTVLLDTPNFWRDLFTSNRQTTTTLIYKLLQLENVYEITNLSSPGDFIQPPLAQQPGFERITTAQSVLAIVSWISLAFVVFRHLQNPWLKYLGSFLVLLFGFSPQMAEWDYVMLTEPASLSLFVLFLALSLELVLAVARERKSPSRVTYVLLALWFMVTIAWVFSRDTNAYLLLVILFAFGILVLIKSTREHLPLRPLLEVAVLLALLFLGANYALQRSGRWENPFFNNLIAHILPNPEYLAFFEKRGLPVTDEVRALEGTSLSSLEYFKIDYLVEWVEKNGTRTYMEFILTHPGWAVKTILANSAAAFGESTQPFFARNPDITPDGLFYFGRLLHPVNTSLLFVAAAHVGLFAVMAFTSTNPAKKLSPGCFSSFSSAKSSCLVSVFWATQVASCVTRWGR